MGNAERPVQVKGRLSKIRASFLIGDCDAITTYDTYEAAKKLFIHTATLHSKDDVRVPESFAAPTAAPTAPTKTFSQEMIDKARTLVNGAENLMAAVLIKKYFKCSIEDARALLRIMNPQVPPIQSLPEETAAPFHCVLTGELALCATDPNDDQYYPGEIKPICLQHFAFSPGKASDIYRIHLSLDGVEPSIHPMAYLDILTTAKIFGAEGNLLQQQSNRGLQPTSSLLDFSSLRPIPCPLNSAPAIPFHQASTWVKLAFVNRTSKNTPENPFAFQMGDFKVSEFQISFFMGVPPQPFASTPAFEKYSDKMVHVPLGQDTDIQISRLKEAKIQWQQLFTARFQNEGGIDRRMLINGIIIDPLELNPIQRVTTELFAATPPTVQGRLFDLVTQTKIEGIRKVFDPKTGSTSERPATFITRSHVGDEYIPLYLSTSKAKSDKPDNDENEDI